MSLRFTFHPAARAEFDASVDWYESRRLGVGQRFAIAIRDAIDSALEAPEMHPTWPEWNHRPTVRTKGVRGFPYRLVYFVHDASLTIVAVAHHKRLPGYWQDRVTR